LKRPFQFWWLSILPSPSRPNSRDVAHRHEHGRFVGDDTEMIKAAGGTEDSFLFDPFDDA